MPEPIRTGEELCVRGDALEQQLEGELDLAAGEQALAEVKAQLAYLRHCQQVLEARKHELPLEAYRDLRPRLCRMRRYLKQAHYSLLRVQEENLYLMSEYQA
jgi:hypothetical protein